MTEKEFIDRARLDWAENNIFSLEDALEACYMNGMYQGVGGNVDSPTGHFYLIERWMVVTDTQGNRTVHTHETKAEAETAFNKLEWEYDEWDED